MNQQLRIIFDPASNTRSLELPVLEKRFKANQELILVTSASAWLYDGTTLIQTASLSGGTITNFEESLSFILSASTIGILLNKRNVTYHIVWKINGTELLDRWYDIVFWKMETPISEYDIIMERPELDVFRPEKKCQINAITSQTEFICNQLIEPTHFWEGSIFESNTKLDSNEVRRVTIWDLNSRTLTIDNALTFNASINDRFTLRRGFYLEILSAWNDIKSMFQSWTPKFFDNNNIATLHGTSKLIDGFDIRFPHLYLTIVKICERPSIKESGVLEKIKVRYEQRFSEALQEMRVKIDDLNSGVFDNQYRTGQIWQQF